METIPPRDRGILRELAARQLAYAHAPENEVILKKWDALAHRRRESPTVRLLFSNFPHEVVTPRMRCEGDEARRLEYTLLSGLLGAPVRRPAAPDACHRAACNGISYRSGDYRPGSGF